jgi:hypothetical protein
MLMVKKIKIGRRFAKWLRSLFNTSFDNRFEAFVQSLFEIEGLKEILSDVSRGMLTAFQIRTIIELTTLKSNLLNKYIPDAVQSANSVKKAAKSSKYRQYFLKVNFDDSVHEVIRLGYVNIFHKLEGFRDELIALVNERGRELFNKDVDIAAYLIRVHKFEIGHPKNYPETIRRIQWICNCVKHYGGYPKKKNPPDTCKGMDMTKKIELPKEDLERDIDFLIEFTTRLFLCATLALGCVRLEEIFDNSDPATKDKLLPSIALIMTIAVVYLHSLQDEENDNFAAKWESFIVGWADLQKRKSPAKS